jgi:hypothetical protein
MNTYSNNLSGLLQGTIMSCTILIEHLFANVFIQRYWPLHFTGKIFIIDLVADVPKKSPIGLNCGILGGLSTRRMTLLSET